MNRHGFTLVEVMAAGAIFLLALSIFSSAFKIGSNYYLSAGEKACALCEAKTEMENLRQISFDKLSSANALYFAGGKGEVFIHALSAELLSIELNYHWKETRPPLKIYSLRGRI